MSNANQPQPVVEVHELTKVFKDFWLRPRAKAVQDLSFDIQPGEVFGLLGPNGSGKSTTIKMLLGLLRPTQGSINILEGSPSDVGIKSRIGYLPEESYLYPFLTASETLDFYGRLFNIPSDVRHNRVQELLDMVGLSHTGQRRVGEFSKGMARRVGLAQALINDPELIILDEPTSGLDPIGCRQVKDIILALAERGKSVLLSSHLLADVEHVCHRVGILFGGRLQAVGSLDQLLQQHQRLVVELEACSEEQANALSEYLRDQLQQNPTLKHPRVSLEQYFLDVVSQASEKQVSSGAGSSGTLAPFLTQGEDHA